MLAAHARRGLIKINTDYIVWIMCIYIISNTCRNMLAEFITNMMEGKQFRPHLGLVTACYSYFSKFGDACVFWQHEEGKNT